MYTSLSLSLYIYIYIYSSDAQGNPVPVSPLGVVQYDNSARISTNCKLYTAGMYIKLCYDDNSATTATYCMSSYVIQYDNSARKGGCVSNHVIV